MVSKIDGRVTFDTDLEYLFSTLKNGKYVLTVKRASEKRSINQNDLMWMWFDCIERETGQPKKDVHDHYCKKFLWRQVVWKDNVEYVVGQTSNLNTQQMKDFLTKIQVDALTELGIQLPLPEDRFFEDFYQQYHF